MHLNPMEHAAEVTAGVAVIGIGFDSLLERFQRQLGLAHPVVGVADAHPRVRVARVQLHRTLEADDGLVELTEVAVGDAQVVEHGGVRWGRLRQALQVRQGLGDLAGLEHRQHEIQRRRFGRERHHGDFLVVHRDHCRLALRGVLGREVQHHGCLERLGSNLARVGGQQVRVEAMERDLEFGRHSSQGL